MVREFIHQIDIHVLLFEEVGFHPVGIGMPRLEGCSGNGTLRSLWQRVEELHSKRHPQVDSPQKINPVSSSKAIVLMVGDLHLFVVRLVNHS